MTYQSIFKNAGCAWKRTGTPPARIITPPVNTKQSRYLKVRLGYPTQGTVRHAITVATHIAMSSRADIRPGNHPSPGSYQRLKERNPNPQGVYKRRGDRLVKLNSPTPQKRYSGANKQQMAANSQPRYPLCGDKTPN